MKLYKPPKYHRVSLTDASHRYSAHSDKGGSEEKYTVDTALRIQGVRGEGYCGYSLEDTGGQRRRILWIQP
jgi:hypothetical protein